MKPVALLNCAPDKVQRQGQKLRLILIFVVAALLAWASGCATPDEKPDKGPDTIIGDPPSPENDPYFIQAMPADAIPVAPSGELIAPPQHEASAEKPPAVEKPPVEKPPVKTPGTEKSITERPPVKTPAPEKPAPEKPAFETPAVEKPAEPETQLGNKAAPKAAPVPPPPPSPKVPQCFSCVRICPAEGNCEESDEDIICGWGTHSTASQARRVARAQCDATLDMARQMPVWSRIDGQCPPATCRE